METVPQKPRRLELRKPAGTVGLIESGLVLLLVFGLLFGVLAVLRPFATSILFGSILAIATWPLCRALINHGLGRGMASCVLLVLALLTIALPILWLGPALADQLAAGVSVLDDALRSLPERPEWIASVPLVGDQMTALWDKIVRDGGDLASMLAPYSAQARTLLLSAASTVAESVVHLLLSLLVATMMWRNGEAIVREVRTTFFLLGGDVAEDAVLAAGGAVRSVAYGVVGTAVLQATVLTCGLLVANIPGAVGLGFLALILAISQILAPLIAFIWGGAAWWLFHSGSGGWALFTIVWGLVVSLSDNLIKPWLIQMGVEMPMSLTLLGVFGGFAAFGFLGFFIGPTLLAVAFVLLRAWQLARRSTRRG
jgi:predicted PurR-regulated permease PerM